MPSVCRLDGPGLAAVGWSNAKFTEGGLWFRQTLRFKLTLVLPVLAHFLRGVFSTQHGFSFAQKDTMLISVLYPLVLMLIWTTAYCSVVLRLGDLVLVPPLILVSYGICAHLGQVMPFTLLHAVAAVCAQVSSLLSRSNFSISAESSLAGPRQGCDAGSGSSYGPRFSYAQSQGIGAATRRKGSHGGPANDAS